MNAHTFTGSPNTPPALAQLDTLEKQVDELLARLDRAADSVAGSGPAAITALRREPGGPNGLRSRLASISERLAQAGAIVSRIENEMGGAPG